MKFDGIPYPQIPKHRYISDGVAVCEHCACPESDKAKHYGRIDWKEVYEVLIRVCRALPEDEQMFVSNHQNSDFAESEYRFQGALGFGGKFYVRPNQTMYVSYYKEDETPERIAMAQKANYELQKLYDKANIRP